MTTSKYERWAVRHPVTHPASPAGEGRRLSAMTFLSDQQISEAGNYVELSWVRGMPEPRPHAPERVCDHDQILLHIGMDPATPQVLGGTIELASRRPADRLQQHDGGLRPQGHAAWSARRGRSSTVLICC